MQESVLDHLKTWFQYEKDAHSKTIASLTSVPKEKRDRKEFQKAKSLFAHIVGARWLWLKRMGVLENIPADLFPDNINANELSPMADETHKAWDNYFSSLDQKELERVFEYKSTEGIWYSNEVEEILIQLFGHSWYHRGQIAQLVRNLDETPAEADFVYWTRKEIPSKD